MTKALPFSIQEAIVSKYSDKAYLRHSSPVTMIMQMSRVPGDSGTLLLRLRHRVVHAADEQR